MKKLQSIFCASLLMLAIASTTLAGDITGRTASRPGDITGGKGDITGNLKPGDITGMNALGDITGIWGDITGIIGSILA